MRVYTFAVIGLILVISAGTFLSKDQVSAETITLASTTSLDNSGFYDYILPKFLEETGIDVRVIAVGTGRALSIASKGDADLVLVHDEVSEREFVAQGHGTNHRTFMYNYYILVGGKNDPARIFGIKDILQAFQEIERSEAPFISRGDDSGTHKKEQSLWHLAGIQEDQKKDWYIEAGSGMGATLNMTNQLRAYTLTDSATWIHFKNRSNLESFVQNVPPLVNPYSIILVNPAKHPNVHHAEAKIFSDWLVKGNGAQWIEAFRLEGIQLFHRLTDG